MTVIVALVVKDAILLATDSQMTEDCGIKHLDRKKITEVKFANASVLIAEAGAADWSREAVELLIERARGRTLTDYRAAADLATEVVHEVNEHAWKKCGNDQNWQVTRKMCLNENARFHLVIAHYFDNKPMIFVIDSPLEIANKKNSALDYYTTAGNGSELASYLLGELAHPDMEFKNGVPLAIYVVEKAKQHINGCDGPCQVAFAYVESEARAASLRKAGRPTMENRVGVLGVQQTAVIVQKLAPADHETKNLLRNTMSAAFRDAVDEHTATIVEEMKRTGDPNTPSKMQ